MKAFEWEIESQFAVQSESRSKSLQQKFIKQARKSSEDTQVAGYARFEKVWAG